MPLCAYPSCRFSIWNSSQVVHLSSSSSKLLQQVNQLRVELGSKSLSLFFPIFFRECSGHKSCHCFLCFSFFEKQRIFFILCSWGRDGVLLWNLQRCLQGSMCKEKSEDEGCNFTFSFRVALLKLYFRLSKRLNQIQFHDFQTLKNLETTSLKKSKCRHQKIKQINEQLPLSLWPSDRQCVQRFKYELQHWTA